MSLSNTDKNATLKTLLSSFTLTVAAGSLALLIKPSPSDSRAKSAHSGNQLKDSAEQSHPAMQREEKSSE